MANFEKRDIQKEFYDILSPKDCGRYSKTAKSTYEDAISRMTHTLRDIVRKLNNEEYTKYQPDIDESVYNYYNNIVDAFKQSLDSFMKTGNWTYSTPTTTPETKKMFDTFNKDMNKYGSFFDGNPTVIDSIFKRVVKNLTKNGFSASDLGQKKTSEEEAKKPKMPETISFSKTESYDPKRMENYQPSSRGESMAHSAYLTKRGREFYFSKQYTAKFPEIENYLNDVFNALDNAWFAYASGQTKDLDFSEADSIYENYKAQYPVIEKFDSRVCSAHMVSGGSFTLWDCKDSLRKMKAARDKVVKTVTMEQEDIYSKWERSVDAILNEEGKPSLNAFLDNWVEEIVAHYTNEDNIRRWKSVDRRLTAEITDLNQKINAVAEEWVQSHKNTPGITWYNAREGYKNTEEYEQLNSDLIAATRAKKDNMRDLQIANLGEAGVRKMFKEQAASVKKSFITAVCEKAGILQDGVFYWSEQNTGHLNGIVAGENGHKYKITSFFAGGYNIQKLHVRTKITELVEH